MGSVIAHVVPTQLLVYEVALFALYVVSLCLGRNDLAQHKVLFGFYI
jgi:hypothetical protein